MKKRKAVDPDLVELTEADFRKMRPAREVHPLLVASYERSRGRPALATKKIAVTLRLDPDVVAALRASGPGWQTRTNAILAKWVRKSDKKTLPARRPNGL